MPFGQNKYVVFGALFVPVALGRRRGAEGLGGLRKEKEVVKAARVTLKDRETCVRNREYCECNFERR